MKPTPDVRIKAAAAVWLAAVLGVTAALIHYAGSPGAAGAVPDRWPAGSRIPLDPSRPNLILFAHPHCPCTRATLGELELLMANRQGAFGARVYFIKPAGTTGDWTNTALWRKASSIPGVMVGCDDGLAEARLFGAETSGQTLLYDHDGKLLFRGGITVSRGHSGDNAGRSALEILSNRRFHRPLQTPVFGCPLFAAGRCRKDTSCQP